MVAKCTETNFFVAHKHSVDINICTTRDVSYAVLTIVDKATRGWWFPSRVGSDTLYLTLVPLLELSERNKAPIDTNSIIGYHNLVISQPIQFGCGESFCKTRYVHCSTSDETVLSGRYADNWTDCGENISNLAMKTGIDMIYHYTNHFLVFWIKKLLHFWNKILFHLLCIAKIE